MERRSGKERRKHIDPRYRSVSHAGFVDRRKFDRRKVAYQDMGALISEYPPVRWKVFIGILVAVFLICMCYLTHQMLSKKSLDRRGRKATITLGCHKNDSRNDAGPTERPLDLCQWQTKTVDRLFAFC